METKLMSTAELRSGRYVCVAHGGCLHSPHISITFESGGVWVRVLGSSGYTYTSAHPDCYRGWEKSVKDESHLGYANYLTASVALWIDNTREIALWIHRIADVFTLTEEPVLRFGEWLREYTESTFPDIEDGIGNIFLAVARDQVDWNELAERYINRER